MTWLKVSRDLRMALMRSTTAASTWMKHWPRLRCMGHHAVPLGTCRQGLGAAQYLAGAVGKQVLWSGFPHEPTRTLPQRLGRRREDGLGLRAVRDEVEHRGMLSPLPGAKYRDWVLHGATNPP
jgi:hypothetical protein